ncbi:MAG: hypothetical protein WBP42_05920 [Candidatus Zixiibacteriota bacterium]
MIHRYIPKPGDKVNVRGTVVVIGIIAVMALAGIGVSLFKPQPMSAVEVARQKQMIVFGVADFCAPAQLAQMPAESLDGYIEMMNYIIRIGDSLTVLGKTDVAAADSEYTVGEANAKLTITGLAQRESGARAKALQLAGKNESPLVDSLYQLAHQPMPSYPEEAALLRERNLTIERYVREIFD